MEPVVWQARQREREIQRFREELHMARIRFVDELVLVHAKDPV